MNINGFTPTSSHALGFSCYEHQRIYTYIQSRFYPAPRSPLVPNMAYLLICGVWAAFWLSYPLFPGEDEADQIATVIGISGATPQKVLDPVQLRKLTIYQFQRLSTLLQCVHGSQYREVQLTGGRSQRGQAARSTHPHKPGSQHTVSVTLANRSKLNTFHVVAEWHSQPVTPLA